MKFNQRLKLAGNNFGNAIKSLVLPETELIDATTYGINTGFSSWYFGSNGNDVHFSFSGLNSSLKAYQCCPPVTAIINRKAQAYINGKTWVMNNKAKEAQGEMANRLRSLLKKPNQLQSWKEFEAQAYIYQQIFGYTVILPIVPVGFDNIYAKALWNIPPFMLSIEENERPLYLADGKFIKRITFNYCGTAVPLDPAQVLILKDFTPSLCSLVIPESRVKSVAMPINNIIGAYESRSILINKRGPMYVISSNQTDSSGNIAMTTREKKEVQDDFGQYGLRRNQATAVMTNANIKIDPMGFPTKELMLFEEIEDDIMRLCDAWGWPYQLMASASGTTYANMNDAKKLAYQDSIIPEAESMYEQLNNFLNTSEYNLTLTKDYAHVPALQEDDLKNAQARLNRNNALLIEFRNDVIPLNRWRELNGEDTIAGDGDMYFSQLVAAGKMAATPITVNNNTNSNNENSSDNGNAK